MSPTELLMVPITASEGKARFFDFGEKVAAEVRVLTFNQLVLGSNPQ